ncbi:PTS sugar transporter subunit IIC [Culicoidibacter larvae]|uniref:Permease IIC component n=1 Tax=Culicoidibacter larvae TaxID=2579976 RepID=A0A5R8QAU6_9FIRM|nr:PTS sugar transporter subunit IIC [Culicoidibacter larvae]TLG72745.1 PTS sugar transporter subunit IIC [Culicoidibacter larvae]
MNSFIKFIEEQMVPRVAKVTNNKYFGALRSGFLVIMPLTIIGSIFLIITDFPVPGYSEFMASIFGANWTAYLESAYRATFNMMGFFLAGTIAYKLSEEYKMDALSGLILALVAYVVVTPKEVITESGELVSRVLSFTWLGTQGVITALIVGFLTVEIIRFCQKRKLVITMPASVPDMVSKSFSALIPGIFVVTIFLVISGLSTIFAGSLQELVYKIIQIPLQGLTSNIGAVVLVAGLNGFLWWFGIHPTVVNSIVNPLLNANSMENLELFKNGTLNMATGNVGTIQMIDQFATIGGAGLTIGLVIAMIFVARSSRLKALSKISLVPALFNINEPIVFGLPIVFNPLMLIPVTLAPIVSVLIAYFAMVIGFMPLFNGVVAPWPTPPIFSGFLVAGWQGAVVQVIAIVISTIIYYPFIKALDDQYGKEEVADASEAALVTE